MKTSIESVRRYTDIPSLIDVLSKKRLTLLDPSSWDDKNDTFFMSEYKTKKELKTLTALCFTTAPETYHHWRVFSSGSGGVCIHFDVNKIFSNELIDPNIKSKKVTYMTMKEMKEIGPPAVDELPFLKRYQYRDEKEYRILYQSSENDKPVHHLSINLESITRITLSPWLHPSLTEGIKRIIKDTEGCKSLKVYRSTLIGNEIWKSYAKK